MRVNKKVMLIGSTLIMCLLGTGIYAVNDEAKAISEPIMHGDRVAAQLMDEEKPFGFFTGENDSDLTARMKLNNYTQAKKMKQVAATISAALIKQQKVTDSHEVYVYGRLVRAMVFLNDEGYVAKIKRENPKIYAIVSKQTAPVVISYLGYKAAASAILSMPTDADNSDTEQSLAEIFRDSAGRKDAYQYGLVLSAMENSPKLFQATMAINQNRYQKQVLRLMNQQIVNQQVIINLLKRKEKSKSFWS